LKQPFLQRGSGLDQPYREHSHDQLIYTLSDYTQYLKNQMTL